MTQPPGVRFESGKTASTFGARHFRLMGFDFGASPFGRR